MIAPLRKEDPRKLGLERVLVAIGMDSFGMIDRPYLEFINYATDLVTPFYKYPDYFKPVANYDPDGELLTVGIKFPSNYLHPLCIYSNETKTFQRPKSRKVYYTFLEFVLKKEDIQKNKFSVILVQQTLKKIKPEDVEIAKEILRPFLESHKNLK